MANDTHGKDPDLLRVKEELTCSLCRELNGVDYSSIKASPSNEWHQLRGVKFTGKEIGCGTYGKLFEVEYEGTLCAAKEIRSASISKSPHSQEKILQDNLLNECQTWSTLHHPCITQFIGVYHPTVDKFTLPLIVMERMHGSLRGLVEECADIPMNITLSILNDVCLGLQYLHSREPPIVHQNLTPNNILLCYHFKAKISDIGIVNVSHTTDTPALSQASKMSMFLPPETLTNKSVNDLSLDMFSFGGIILYIATNQWPQTAQIRFDPDTGKRSVILTEIQRHQQSLDKMAERYANLKPLVISCLDDNPQGRPSVVQALMEIKKVKIAHSQKLCAMIWGTEDMACQLQKGQEQLPQLEAQEPKELIQQGVEETLQHVETQRHHVVEEPQPEQCKVEEGMNQLEVQSPQIVTNGGLLEDVMATFQGMQRSPSPLEDTLDLGDSPSPVNDVDTPDEELIYPLFIAKYDYMSRGDREMSFKRGDQFYIINNDDNDWWFARAKHSGQEGCVPNNYVTRSPLDAEDWFFGDISQAEAEELLMQSSITHGTFLICKSKKRGGEYSLSLRYLDEVKHCEIYRVGDSVYLSPKESFQSISELVVYYNRHSLPTANDQEIKLKSFCPHILRTTDSPADGDRWETRRESISLVKKIETGRFSETWEGLWNDTTLVTVTTARLDIIDTKRIRKEMEILKQISHPNLIELYAVCTKGEPIYIITELTKHGSLLGYLRGDGRSLELPQLLNMMVQIATGMAFLGEKNYIHQDLAARNVMLAEGLVCKVADFGSVQATSAGIYEAHPGIKVPIKWSALEVVLYSYFTIKSDVWSFGIVMYELVTCGRLPYPGMNNHQVVDALKTGYRMVCPPGCPEHLYEIMAECWREEAASRPTFEELQCRLEEFSTKTDLLQVPSGQPFTYNSEDDDIDDDKNDYDDNEMLKTTSYINLQPLGQETTAEEGEEVENSNYVTVNEDPLDVPDFPVVVAKFDYVQRTDEDLSFKKGDMLYILNKDSADWWLVKNASDEQGFIPSNHVMEYSSIEAQKWYFGAIDLQEAEDLLMHKTNTSGSFLVRESTSTPGSYSLAVRNAENVIHYRIHQADNGNFHIVPCVVFPSVVDLVAYYGKQSDGLCANLMYPCAIGENDEKPQTVGESEKPEDIEVDKESVRLIKQLGIGRFGEVWQAMWNKTTPVAVKMLNVGSTGLHDFVKAAVLMKQLSHPKLIQVYAVSTKDVPIYIIAEMMMYGSLLEYVKNKSSSLRLPQLIDMGAQVASGMAYLEENNCLHRDLAARNIYITVNLICKVAGFSITRASETACVSHNRGMSPVKWTALEALIHGRFTIKSDVWSFGILLYELITYGLAPYAEMNNAQVIEELQNGYRIPCPVNCPEQLYEIMTDCWNDDAKCRPTFETMVSKLENFFGNTTPTRKRSCPDEDLKEQQDDKEIPQKQQHHDQQEWGEQTLTQQGEQESDVKDFQQPLDDQEQGLQQLNEQEQENKPEQQLDGQEQQLDGQEQPFEEVPSSSGPPSNSSTTPTPPPLVKTFSFSSFKSLKDIKDIIKRKKGKHKKEPLSRTNTFPNLTPDETPDDKLSNSDLKMETSDYPLYVGKYSYLSRTNNDLAFKKGDLLYILNTDDEDWWWASNRLGQEGYVPSNHVVTFGSMDAEEWYFGSISRFQADKLLMASCNDNGSFLIRDSERASGGYSLSVKNGEEVIHYRVQKIEGMGYFVGRKASFETLSELIAHYKKQPDGLCATLSDPCFVEKPQTAGLSKETNTAWDIDRKSISLTKKLGSGQFGEVWQGTWNDSVEVAVKVFKPGDMGPSKFLEKAATMRKMRHPKLVQVYAMCTKEQPIYMVTEFLKHGSLLDNLKSSGRSLELRHLIDIGAQVASGMAYLEEKNYVHRNLAARNVLMSGRYTCKVTDYGLARDDDSTGAKFIIKWTAPEAALYNKFSVKSDVWSFGILLYEIVSYGRFPYPGMNNAQVLEALRDSYRMPAPMCCPDQLYNIMLECWNQEAAARPPFESLQQRLEEFFTKTLHTANLYPTEGTST